MGEAEFSKLNEGQRDCLRLVSAHLNSKEIGRKLNISPHTVDQRLRQAMRVLEANSRFEAARKFAEHEGDGTYQPLIYQTSDIANSGQSVSLNRSAKQEADDDQKLIDSVSDIDKGSAALAIENNDTSYGRLPIPRYRGDKNNLSAIERLGWIVAIAIGSAVSFGGIIAGLEALSRLSR